MWNYNGKFSITSSKQNWGNVCQLCRHRDLKIFLPKNSKIRKNVWFSPVFGMLLISTFYMVRILENWQELMCIITICQSSFSTWKCSFLTKNVHFAMLLNFENYFMNGIMFSGSHCQPLPPIVRRKGYQRLQQCTLYILYYSLVDTSVAVQIFGTCSMIYTPSVVRS